ncbi:MAG: Uma2 family endonuclease [Defluviitaleaceae bacterium]|nr:Uma2 family endonuclease [Defluviitaleaceae bacterium]
MIISPDQSPLKRYTYADYLTWNDGVNRELIDGIPYIKYEQIVDGKPCAMAAPASGHQLIFRELFLRLGNFLSGKQCQVLSAPFDVRLNACDDDDEDVVLVFQPDIFVVCDKTKIDKKGCKGAPDMVIEILSPTTRKKDKLIKMQKYQQHGVREYWAVDPDARWVDVYLLVEGRYVMSGYGEEDIAPVMVLPDCEINLTEVFAPLDDIE